MGCQPARNSGVRCPAMWWLARGVWRDVQAALGHDPAARSTAEIVLAYPGVHALALHRVAHRLWRAGSKLPARILSHAARFGTGVEIHPGATIADGGFIDPRV